MERPWPYVFISQSEQVKRILVVKFGVSVCGRVTKKIKENEKEKEKGKGTPSPQVSCHKWVLKLHP